MVERSQRAGEIGTDDKGVSYWYFGDESWVYAEDKPRWQLEERYVALQLYDNATAGPV